MRRVRRIAQRLSQRRDGVVQPVIEIDIHIRGPQLLAQLLTGNDLPGAFDQQLQKLSGLLTESNTTALLAQLTRLSIELKNAESDTGQPHVERVHRLASPSAKPYRAG